MQDLIRLRNANIALWNHMNMQSAKKAAKWKEGDPDPLEVPIGHDHTFPIMVNLVDSLQTTQEDIKNLLVLEDAFKEAWIEEAEALKVKNDLELLGFPKDASQSEIDDWTHKCDKADDDHRLFTKARIGLSEQIDALKKVTAGKIAANILQLDLIAASCNVELYNNLPAFFNAFAKEHGLLGMEV